MNQPLKKPYWGLVFLLTQLHNPKGTSYSEARCRKVVELARKYNVLVLTDDVYFPFRYDGYHNKNVGDVLVSYDRCNWSSGTGHVVSNGSFSKVIFPSLRIGWMEASPWFIQRFSERNDLIGGGGYNAFNQKLCAFALKSPKFWDFFTECKSFYISKIKLCCEYLEKHLPSDVTFDRPVGSFFLWVRLPKGADSEVLLERCRQYHVRFVPGIFYASDRNSRKYCNYFRIATVNLEDKKLLMSLHVICTQAKIYLDEIKSRINGH